MGVPTARVGLLAGFRFTKNRSSAAVLDGNARLSVTRLSLPRWIVPRLSTTRLSMSTARVDLLAEFRFTKNRSWAAVLCGKSRLSLLRLSANTIECNTIERGKFYATLPHSQRYTVPKYPVPRAPFVLGRWNEWRKNTIFHPPFFER